MRLLRGKAQRQQQAQRKWRAEVVACFLDAELREWMDGIWGQVLKERPSDIDE